MNEHDHSTPCDKCGHVMQLGEFPFCPHGFGSMKVVEDSIPGGLTLEHGLCDPVTAEPRTYYSKSEIQREAKKRGLIWREFTGESPKGRRWF